MKYFIEGRERKIYFTKDNTAFYKSKGNNVDVTYMFKKTKNGLELRKKYLKTGGGACISRSCKIHPEENTIDITKLNQYLNELYLKCQELKQYYKPVHEHAADDSLFNKKINTSNTSLNIAFFSYVYREQKMYHIHDPKNQDIKAIEEFEVSLKNILDLLSKIKPSFNIFLLELKKHITNTDLIELLKACKEISEKEELVARLNKLKKKITTKSFSDKDLDDAVISEKIYDEINSIRLNCDKIFHFFHKLIPDKNEKYQVKDLKVHDDDDDIPTEVDNFEQAAQNETEDTISPDDVFIDLKNKITGGKKPRKKPRKKPVSIKKK